MTEKQLTQHIGELMYVVYDKQVRECLLISVGRADFIKMVERKEKAVTPTDSLNDDDCYNHYYDDDYFDEPRMFKRVKRLCAKIEIVSYGLPMILNCWTIKEIFATEAEAKKYLAKIKK